MVSFNGVLSIFGVSKNGYYSFKKRLPSDRQQRKEAIMNKIMKIYGESHQNYGAPKITEKLHSEGETISEKKESTEEFVNSYSKKAFPWDNACIESFHALIKREWINRFKI